MTSVAQRPKLCVCPRTCTPIWNAMVCDPRIKDEQGDMAQGYSGECVGQMNDATEFVYGGAIHRNDVNVCVFTPLKGIIRYQENAEDLWSSIVVRRAALDKLNPLVCSNCGEDSRLNSLFLHLIDPDWLKTHPRHTSEEYNSAPRKVYCQFCAVGLGLLKPHAENFGKTGFAKWF